MHAINSLVRTRFPVLITIFVFLFSMGGCDRQPEQPQPEEPSSKAPTAEPATGPLPVWTTDPAVLEKLAGYQDLDNYQIRPPLEYPLARTVAPKATIFAWSGPLRPDQTAPMITIIVAKPMPAQKSPEQIMQDLLDGIKRRRQDWQQSTFERGLVNGLAFLRARWSGTEPSKGWNMHGLMYVAQDNDALIQISTEDVEPHDKEALRISEAAALTFKKN